MKFGKIGLFFGGVLFGTAGLAVLSSKDAKNAYTQCTAAVLRCKDSVMNATATVKENCGDIYADAKDINEKRYEQQRLAELEKAKAIVEQYEAAEENVGDADFSEVTE